MSGDLTSTFLAAGQRYNVDPRLLMAVAWQESNGDPGARSPAGALGLMQLMPQTAKSLGVNPFDPVQAIDGGARVLSQNLARYGNVEDALRAYNAGTDPTHWNNPETQAYVPGVAAKFAALPPIGTPPGPAPAPAAQQLADAGQEMPDEDAFAAPGVGPGPVTASGGRQYADSGRIATDASTGPARNPYASMSSGDFFAATAGAPQSSAAPAPSSNSAKSSTSSPSVANPYAGMSPGDFFAATAGTPATGQQAATTTSSTAGSSALASAASPVGTALRNFGAGVVQGGEDVARSLNQGAAWVDQHVPALAALDRTFGQDPAAAAAAQQAEQQQFQAQHGDSTAASIGRVAGNMLASAPLVEVGGAGLGLAGSVLADAAGGAATGLGRGLTAAGDLVSGTAAAPGSVANPLIRGTSLALNGAGQGAAYTALGSSTSDQPLGSQLAEGALTGALANPLLGGVVAAGGKVGSALKAAVQPFSAAGRDAIADSVIARAAQGGPVAVNATPLIPGSTPTLAQATANPGIAAVERAVSDVRPNPFIAQQQANASARDAALDAVRGDPQSLQNLIDARAQQAQQQYGAAFTNTSPVSPQPVLDTIDQILASPSGQRDAVASALGNIRSKLIVQPGGSSASANMIAGMTGQPVAAAPARPAVLQTDPAQLYGVRQAITDMLSPLSQGKDSDSRLAAAELGQVKDALDPVIEQGAPGYNQALGDFAASSAPIDAMRYLQGLNLTDAQGNITLAKVKGALDNISRQQALPGPRDAKSIPQSTVDTLQALYDDLSRQGNSALGKSIGSNTFQNLAVSNALTALGAPIAPALSLTDKIPGANLLTAGVRRAYEAQNPLVLDALVNKLIDPSAGASALQPAAPGWGQNALMALQPYAPAVAVAGNRLMLPPPARNNGP